MLNHNVAPSEFFSSFALNMRCATYPPPPGSAPGYQLAHHCTPRYNTNVITGSVQIASVVQPRWKLGKNAVTSLVGWPVARTASFTCESCSFSNVMPPIFETATHASTMIIVIFKTNWNRSVTSTPQSPPMNV